MKLVFKGKIYTKHCFVNFVVLQMGNLKINPMIMHLGSGLPKQLLAVQQRCNIWSSVFQYLV